MKTYTVKMTEIFVIPDCETESDARYAARIMRADMKTFSEALGKLNGATVKQIQWSVAALRELNQSMEEEG